MSFPNTTALTAVSLCFYRTAIPRRKPQCFSLCSCWECGVQSALGGPAALDPPGFYYTWRLRTASANGLPRFLCLCSVQPAGFPAGDHTPRAPLLQPLACGQAVPSDPRGAERLIGSSPDTAEGSGWAGRLREEAYFIEAVTADLRVTHQKITAKRVLPDNAATPRSRRKPQEGATGSKSPSCRRRAQALPTHRLAMVTGN